MRNCGEGAGIVPPLSEGSRDHPRLSLHVRTHLSRADFIVPLIGQERYCRDMIVSSRHTLHQARRVGSDRVIILSRSSEVHLSKPDPRTIRRIRRQFDGGTAVPLALTALLVASLFWAVSLRGNRDDAYTRVTELQAEIDQIRSQANATVYQLNPTAESPPNAHGSAFFSLSGTGVISVVNLDPVPVGRGYQVWYYPTSDAEPLPGATFSVDDHGTGFMLIPADVGVFTDISVTLEPEAGASSPSGTVILTGSTGGARG